MGAAENRVTKACRDWLALHGAKMVRVQSGMMRWGEGKMMRMAESGTADLVGVWRGRALAVECKRPLGPRGGTGGSKQSEDQIRWQAEWEEKGGLYVVARSSEDLEAQLVNPHRSDKETR